jgi:hypothetical protein
VGITVSWLNTLGITEWPSAGRINWAELTEVTHLFVAINGFLLFVVDGFSPVPGLILRMFFRPYFRKRRLKQDNISGIIIIGNPNISILWYSFGD